MEFQYQDILPPNDNQHWNMLSSIVQQHRCSLPPIGYQPLYFIYFLINDAKVFFFLLLANNAEAFSFTNWGFWGIFCPLNNQQCKRHCYILLAFALCMVCSTLHTHDPCTAICAVQACHISMQYLLFTPVLSGSNRRLLT